MKEQKKKKILFTESFFLVPILLNEQQTAIDAQSSVPSNSSG
jgi:hypothetical protein